MTCQCDALAARIAAIEARLGISQQATLFAGDTGATDSPGLKYQKAFEDVWERTGRVGTKFKAYKAWEKVGRPPWAAIAPGHTAYMRSKGPADNYVQDLSTWLSNRGWEQDWPLAPKYRAAVAGKAPAATGPTYAPPTSDCFAHAENPRAHTKRITPGCERCKEQAAREAGRTMTEDEALEPTNWIALSEPIA